VQRSIGGDYPPYIWKDDDGQHRGMIPQLITKLLGDIGYQPQWFNHSQQLDRPADLTTLLQKNSDPFWLVVNQPIATFNVRGYVRSQQLERFHSLADLAGAKGSLSSPNLTTMTKSPIYHYLSEQKVDLVNIPSVSKAFEALIDKQIDVGFHDHNMARAVLQLQHKNQQIAELPFDLLGSHSLYLAINRHSALAAHQATLKNRLAFYHNSGYIKLIRVRAMQSYLSQPADTDKPVATAQ
jgi:ABC-type amino acid transport substrate-binding protein